MNKTELLHILEETVPPLRGKLHIERVLYQKAANKAYMSFLSDELVAEHDYLLLERVIKVEAAHAAGCYGIIARAAKKRKAAGRRAQPAGKPRSGGEYNSIYRHFYATDET